MIHILASELHGWWRWAGLCIIFIAALLPVLPLVYGVLCIEGLSASLQNFYPVLLQSLGVNFAGSFVALLAGMVLGLLHSFYTFRGKRLFLLLFLLPMASPPLFWAQGLKFLDAWFVKGAAGAIYIISIVTMPLVMFSTFSACALLTSCQCDAARLSGGEPGLMWNAARFCFPVALMASLLGACLMLSTPGAFMVLGVKSAASEILVSFSALYDMHLATSQCIVLSAAVAATVILSMILAGRRPVEILSVSAGSVRPRYHKIMSRVGLAVHTLFILLALGVPLLGLLLPALSSLDIGALSSTLDRTAGNTLFYAVGSASAATVAGAVTAFFMGKPLRYRAAGMGAMVLIFSLPAAFPALGLVTAAASAPQQLDPILRSRAVVSISQAAHLFPVSAVLISRAISSMPTSWAWAAELHGIPFVSYVRKIVFPRLARPIFSGFLITLLLSQADVATVQLLHPPGSQSLPLAVLTIMANAPKAVVAQLNLTYIIITWLVLYLMFMVWDGNRLAFH